jgi:hypothetical protein
MDYKCIINIYQTKDGEKETVENETNLYSINL